MRTPFNLELLKTQKKLNKFEISRFYVKNTDSSIFCNITFTILNWRSCYRYILTDGNLGCLSSVCHLSVCTAVRISIFV